MANTDADKTSSKDEIVNDIHEIVLGVQRALDKEDPVRSDQTEPGEHAAAEPGELPAKQSEVQPGKDP